MALGAFHKGVSNWNRSAPTLAEGAIRNFCCRDEIFFRIAAVEQVRRGQFYAAALENFDKLVHEIAEDDFPLPNTFDFEVRVHLLEIRVNQILKCLNFLPL